VKLDLQVSFKCIYVFDQMFVRYDVVIDLRSSLVGVTVVGGTIK